MNFRRALILSLAVFSAVVACRAEVSPAPVARVHWIGKKQLAADAGAAHFLSIWNLPESAAWQDELLEKIARVPWTRFHGGDISSTNRSSAWLRPLLDDLVQEESYVEVRGEAGRGEFAFAIRLPAERARLWESNLRLTLEELTELRVATNGSGWSLKKHHAPDFIQCTRAGDWTLLGAGAATNVLFGDFIARIARDHVPFVKPATNFWLAADVDLNRTAQALAQKWSLPAQFPRVVLNVAGGGDELVRSRGTFDFDQPLPWQAEPWRIPTNAVRDVVEGFTAVRGVGPWLAQQKFWSDLQVGAAPNQWFAWSMQGFWAQEFFAAAVPDASNRLSQISARLIQDGTPWLAANSMGKFMPKPIGHGVMWGDVPFATPDLQAVGGAGGDFILGEIFPMGGMKSRHPQAMFGEMLRQPELVYYDWELTGPRLDAWLHIGQLFRMFLRKPELDSPAVGWFAAAAPKLGVSVTEIQRVNQTQFSFARSSSVGLTAFELHLLADWAESPTFPAGLQTLVTPAMRKHRARQPVPMPMP